MKTVQHLRDLSDAEPTGQILERFEGRIGVAAQVSFDSAVHQVPRQVGQSGTTDELPCGYRLRGTGFRQPVTAAAGVEDPVVAVVGVGRDGVVVHLPQQVDRRPRLVPHAGEVSRARRLPCGIVEGLGDAVNQGFDVFDQVVVLGGAASCGPGQQRELTEQAGKARPHVARKFGAPVGQRRRFRGGCISLSMSMAATN